MNYAGSLLFLAVVPAFSWQEMMDSGTYPSLQALADSVGLDRSYVGRMLTGLPVAPDRGVDPPGGRTGRLSVDELAKSAPMEWGAQLGV